MGGVAWGGKLTNLEQREMIKPTRPGEYGDEIRARREGEEGGK